MTRRCSLTGKAVQVGNKVSHSNKKTKKRFQPNLQNVTMISDVLNRKIKLRIATSALRSIEVKGGIDLYLLDTDDNDLSQKAREFKKLIKKAKAAE